MSSRKMRFMIAQAVAMTMFVAAAVLILPSCQRKPVMSHAKFMHLPATGWQRTMPLTFVPEYDDTVTTYDIKLAIRHDITYSYRNLSLAVDIIDVDSVVNRRMVDMALADEYGNWTGGGFGTLYQDAVTIAHVIDPGDASAVVVWQAMQGCDTLCGLVDVGIIVIPL